MKTLYIDNSILKEVAACDTAAVMRYVHDLTSIEDRAELLSGNAGHEALALYLQKGKRKPALQKFTDLYKDWADTNVSPNSPLARLTHENTYNIIRAWMRQHPIDTLPFTVRPELVEIGFKAPIYEGTDFNITLTGRMDLIGADKQTAQWYIVDHKFTGQVSAYWAKKFRLDSQISGYIYAAQQHVGKRVVGAYINAIELSKLPTDPRKRCPRHSTTYHECGPLHTRSQFIIVQRTPHHIEQWRRAAIAIAKRFVALTEYHQGRLKRLHEAEMQGMFNGACRFCSFADFCSVGRPLKYAKTMFKSFHWDPLERSEGETLNA